MNILNTILNLLPSLTSKLSAASERKTTYWNDSCSERLTHGISGCRCTQIIETAHVDGKWQMPVQDVTVTSPYGWRTLAGKRHFHAGVDYTGRNLTAVAPADCVVKKVLFPDADYPERFRYNSHTGKWEAVQVPQGRAWTPYVVAVCTYDENIRFVFRHGEPLHYPGEFVRAGEEIISTGNYGYSLGAHVHFEVRKLGADGKWQTCDPDKFLKTKIKNQARKGEKQ